MLRAAWLWLLVPGALVLSYAVWVAAAFTSCGVSGCSGGGFGRSDNALVTSVLLLLSGAVGGLPLLITSWNERRSVRAAVFAVVAILIAVVGWAYVSLP